MITYIIIVSVLIYFLKTSKSTFFLNDREFLAVKRQEMISLLYIKKRSQEDIQLYKDAFDFFTMHPKKFDGATIVKDLNDLPRLDIDAMVHDYECLIGANRNFIKWYLVAWNYFENMRKNGKGNQIIRFVLLCLAGVIFVPYCFLFTKKYSELK